MRVPCVRPLLSAGASPPHPHSLGPARREPVRGARRAAWGGGARSASLGGQPLQASPPPGLRDEKVPSKAPALNGGCGGGGIRTWGPRRRAAPGRPPGPRAGPPGSAWGPSAACQDRLETRVRRCGRRPEPCSPLSLLFLFFLFLFFFFGFLEGSLDSCVRSAPSGSCRFRCRGIHFSCTLSLLEVP